MMKKQLRVSGNRIIQLCNELVDCDKVNEEPGRGNVHVGKLGEPEME